MKAIIFSIMLTCLFGCRANPAKIALAEVVWTRYSNPVLGYSLDYPDTYTLTEGGNHILLGYHSDPQVLVRYTDEAEGRQRGLWFGHAPADSIQLGGRPGKKYEYDHGDGPFYSRTIAYVVDYRDRYLGLEFRTNNELNDVEKQILQSFKFDH
jgi:hypothetical protein